MVELWSLLVVCDGPKAYRAVSSAVRTGKLHKLMNIYF